MANKGYMDVKITSVKMNAKTETQNERPKVIEVLESGERYIWRRSNSVETISDAARWFLATQQAQKLSDNTIKTYCKSINSLGLILADITGNEPNNLPIGTLNRDDLTDAFTEYAATRAMSSQRQARSIWNSMCRFLAAEEVIVANPMDRVPAISNRRGKTIPKSLPPEAVESLLSYLADPTAETGEQRQSNSRWRERDYALVLLFLVTGARESEMVSVNIGDLVEPYGHEGARSMKVHGKGDKERLLTIEAGAVEVLEAYLESRYLRLPKTGKPADTPWGHWKLNDPLFVDAKGQRMNADQMYYRVKVAYREAGINSYRAEGALVHQLRHTLATTMADDPEVTLFQLRHLLGHSSLSSTERYTAGAGRATREAARRNPVYKLIKPTQDDGQ